MNKMKKKKYHTVRTIPKSNIKMVERGKIDTPNTQNRYLNTQNRYLNTQNRYPNTQNRYLNTQNRYLNTQNRYP